MCVCFLTLSQTGKNPWPRTCPLRRRPAERFRLRVPASAFLNGSYEAQAVPYIGPGEIGRGEPHVGQKIEIALEERLGVIVGVGGEPVQANRVTVPDADREVGSAFHVVSHELHADSATLLQRRRKVDRETERVVRVVRMFR